MAETTVAAPSSEAGRLITIGVATFVVAGVGLFMLAQKMGPPGGMEPGYPINEVATQSPSGEWMVTIDSSSREDWIGYSFALGRKVPAGAAADILIMRHYLQAPGGVQDLGLVPLDEAEVPTAGEWVEDTLIDGVKRNAALSDWYSYSYWTHLLRTEKHSYAVQMVPKGTDVALVQVASYYCQPEGSGCLTLRYRLP